MDHWSDEELISFTLAAMTGGRIDPDSAAFGKAEKARMLDRRTDGWVIRDSARDAAVFVLDQRQSEGES
jgi:hypothetical protein